MNTRVPWYKLTIIDLRKYLFYNQYEKKSTVARGSNLKLVLQPVVRALRAVYGQILKKLYGTRTLHARHTHGFLSVFCPGFCPVCNIGIVYLMFSVFLVQLLALNVWRVTFIVTW